MVEYHYIKLVINDWDRVFGNSVQVSDFRVGVETQEDLFSILNTVKIETSDGIETSQVEYEVDLLDNELIVEFTLLQGHTDPVVTVDGVTYEPHLSDGVYVIKLNIYKNTNITIVATQITFSVNITPGKGIESVTPMTANVAEGEPFEATFVVAMDYRNPTLISEDAFIEGNTIHIPSVTSNMSLTIFATKTTNVSEKVHQSVKIYPNPVLSGQVLNIDLSLFDNNNPPLLTIFCADGKVIKQKTITEENFKTVMNYVPGVYFLRIKYKNEEMLYRIIVQ